MKKIVAIVLCIMLMLSIAGCGKRSETTTGAPPAKEFSTAEEAVQTIRAVKETGPERMPHPDDYNLFNKDYICLLNELPLSGFEQTAIMLVSQGTVTYYESEKHTAIFYWYKGYEQTEELSERYTLKQYKDTKYYFGESVDDIYIFWWENGDQFELMYPKDTNILPEETARNLVVDLYYF